MEKGTGDIENKQEVAERASKRSEWARKESRRARGREIEYFNNFSPSAPAQTRSQRAHVTCPLGTESDILPLCFKDAAGV